MKKLFLICLSVILISSMASCKFIADIGQNLTDSMEEKSESAPKVEEMMAALAENRVSDAKALLHPDVAESSDAAISQMIAYLNGRKVSSFKLNGINLSVSADASGKARAEELCYVATLDDGEIVCVNASYRSDSKSGGFVSFQISLGAFQDYTDLLSAE